MDEKLRQPSPEVKPVDQTVADAMIKLAFGGELPQTPTAGEAPSPDTGTSADVISINGERPNAEAKLDQSTRRHPANVIDRPDPVPRKVHPDNDPKVIHSQEYKNRQARARDAAIKSVKR